MKRKLPRVIEWRFPKRAGAIGQHSDNKCQRPGPRPGIIKIDPRLTPRDRCEVLIHETIHEVCPYLEEYMVRELGDVIERVLHRDNWRKIYVSEIPK